MSFVLRSEPAEKYYRLEAAGEPTHPEAVSRPVGLPPDTAIVISRANGKSPSFHAKPPWQSSGKVN